MRPVARWTRGPSLALRMTACWDAFETRVVGVPIQLHSPRPRVKVSPVRGALWGAGGRGSHFAVLDRDARRASGGAPDGRGGHAAAGEVGMVVEELRAIQERHGYIPE